MIIAIAIPEDRAILVHSRGSGLLPIIRANHLEMSHELLTISAYAIIHFFFLAGRFALTNLCVCLLQLGKQRGGQSRKILQSEKAHVHYFSARNSGAENGCANFMGAWHFLVLFAWKTPMPIKFLIFGGGGGSWVFWRGGVEVPILFLWAWGFFYLKWPSISFWKVSYPKKAWSFNG